jgi:hypothetical protein
LMATMLTDNFLFHIFAPANRREVIVTLKETPV